MRRWASFMGTRSIRWTAGVAVLSLTAVPASASAQVLDRFSVHVEGGGGVLLGGDVATRFGPGGDVIARLAVRLVGPLHLQLSALNAWFVSDTPGGPGRLYSFDGGLRLAPRISDGPLGGPFLDINAGIGITGTLQRFTFDAGVGWQFQPLPFFGIGPVVRYAHIYQPDDQPAPDDAHMLFFGLTLSLSVPRGTPADGTVHNEPARPPRDTDGDGVLDPVDRCPTVPEDRDGFQDEDGCPDPDNDSDGFPDASDHCPDQAETRNGFEDEDGCADTPPPAPTPEQAATEALNHQIEEVGSHVLFGNAQYRLRHSARPRIAALCQYMAAHPEVVRLRVEGHADERGSADFNQELSAYRAAAVARALVQCGVSPERIESAGVGSTHWVCSDRTSDCRQRNRRVQFLVIERRGTGIPPSPAP